MGRVKENISNEIIKWRSGNYCKTNRGYLAGFDLKHAYLTSNNLNFLYYLARLLTFLVCIIYHKKVFLSELTFSRLPDVFFFQTGCSATEYDHGFM